ncbi:cation:proton antiporter [Metabacillus sediminilitoris]|uniref:Sodium:proton antiporter n=1 Tax=Metabacillus sediminilitoris TaxID=2567941 RepID=A0A4S4BUU3_9BACI|nr:cation:proton antiporter [Metabacillus sediminilitoris]QGQ44763.1 sodium:proton antiporter [Metabacillus sediminilitoris]THF78889.1 sodium:proton antiporter [Metabacillus sediminilitoris]
MEANVMNIVQHELYMITMVFIFGLLAIKIAERIKIPDVALFMIVGIFLGPSVLNLITAPIDSVSYQFIIVIGSILILFEGGKAIQFSILKRVWLTISLLSIVGVIVTAIVVAISAYYLLDLPVLYALLLASVISSTDPATLIPVFKQVAIREKVRQTVESESAFNDATASILTFTILGVILGQTNLSFSSSLWSFVREAGGGILVGLFFGFIGCFLTAEHKWGLFKKYGTILSIVIAISSYLFAGVIEASGFMATFTAGLILGNPQLFRFQISQENNLTVFHFSETLTLLLRTLIFMLLGTQVNFNILSQFWLQGILIVLIFMFVARPLTVLLCTLPDRKAKWSWNEIFFMFWVRETGVIPAALSGMIVASGVDYANEISSVTFIAILVTILLQASSTGYVAKKLGLILKPPIKALRN